jgi:hypothetical protein
VDEANRSDATERGSNDGKLAGNADAKNEADRVEYPRGREAVRSEKAAEAVQNTDRFAQKTPFAQLKAALDASLSELKASDAPVMSALKSLWVGIMGDERGRGGDRGGDRGGEGAGSLSDAGAGFGPVVISAQYPTPEEQAAYEEGFKQGRHRGFKEARERAYQEAYRGEYRDAKRDGCDVARREDYRSYVEEGRQRGYAQAYREAYDRVYQPAYQEAYGRSYEESRRNTYEANYDRFYSGHFASAKAAASSARYNELYSAAKRQAHDAEYSRSYPAYAQQSNQRGRNDEEADFAARPVRVMSMEVQESVANGLYEPGEALRLKMQLRNHANSAITGKDLRIQIETVDRNGIITSIADESLVKDLQKKSITTVTDAMEFNLTEAAIAQAVSINVKLSLVGKVQDQQKITLVANYQLQVKVQQPELLEGMESLVKVQLTNQAKVASEAGKVALNANNEILEVLDAAQDVPSLRAGESTVLQYRVILRSEASNVRIPLAVSATHSSGRVLGVSVSTPEVPVINDYRIRLREQPSGLRRAGVTRVQYTISNTNKRLSPKSLQLETRVLNDSVANFTVVGPSPQYLAPVQQGNSVNFTIPLNAKTANEGGVLELVVKEKGRVVVVHRVKF